MIPNNTQSTFGNAFGSQFQNNQAITNNGASFLNNQQQTNQGIFSNNNMAFNKPNSNQGLFNTQQSFTNNSINSTPSQGFSTNPQQGFSANNNTPFGGSLVGNPLGGGNTMNTNSVLGGSIGGTNPMTQTNTMGQTGIFGQTAQTMPTTQTGLFGQAGQTGQTGLFNQSGQTGGGFGQIGQMSNQGGFNNNNSTGSNGLNFGASNGASINKLGGNLISQDLAFQTSLENIKIQLQSCSRMMASRNLQNIRLDSWNTLKDKSMNKLPHREQCLSILYNFHQLKKNSQNIKKSNQQIEKRMNNISKNTHEKLALYKRCLLQTVSHNKLIQEVSGELQLMGKEIQDYFKPLYNSFKYKTKVSVKQPNEFDLKISYDVLNKLQILNQRVDDMIACQSKVGNQEFESTISVFEQLIEYYQNVSCSFKQFSGRYNSLKKQAIERSRQGTYQTVMSKVVDKVDENLKKQFKYYDLIKQIDEILTQKDKREQRKRIENELRYQSRKGYY